MATITIGNSYSRITGMTVTEEKKLKKYLSYIVGGKSSYYSGFGPRKKSLLDNKGYFPTGLLHRLIDEPYRKGYQNTTEQHIIVDDKRIKPETGDNLVLKSSYEWQNEALDAVTNNPRGIISAPTGTGKSRTMEMIVKFLSVKTLIVVPSVELKKQLLENNFKNWSQVRIENIDSPALKNLTDFDCLIIDEAHHVAAKTYQKLNKTAWNKIYHRYFFTATPFRNDDEETILFEAIAGELIYKLSYKQAMRDKYIVPVESYFIEIPKQDTNAYTYQQVYKELVVENTARNLEINSLLRTLQHEGKSTLCLVKEVRHGEILSKLTGLPFITGDDPDSRKHISSFNKGEERVVIATTGIMGEGIDSKPCEYVVIAGLGKAKSQFLQQIGRAVRNYENKQSAKIILIKDTSHKFLLRHFNAQKKILLDECGSITLRLQI